MSKNKYAGKTGAKAGKKQDAQAAMTVETTVQVEVQADAKEAGAMADAANTNAKEEKPADNRLQDQVSEGASSAEENEAAAALEGKKSAGNDAPAAASVNEAPAAAAGNGAPAAVAGNGDPSAVAVNGAPFAAAVNGSEASSAPAEKKEPESVLPQRSEAEKQKVREAAAEVLAREKKIVKGAKRRSAEIFNVFARHNYYVNGFTPEELRTTLEDLGPTYVKIGQIMSSRGDMLPERYCKELEKLRQNVKELDPKLARAVIEEQTGFRIEDIYSEFRDKPLGSASIGQVHYGVLKNGQKVVTKVRRPFIAEMMRQDFELLKNLAKGMHIVMEDSDTSDSQMDFVEVIEEFEKVTEEELDFRVEARNTKFFRENCIEDENVITCPHVVDELTTEQIYTMSFVDGYSISKKERVIADGYDPEKICRTIVENYLHQVLDVGVFHADPHQGNIMVSHGKPVWIDFGMIGRIGNSDVNILQSLLLGVLEGDSEGLATALMSMGTASPKTKRNLLIEDLDSFLDRYGNVTSISDLNVSVLFGEVVSLTEKHHVKLPSKATMLIRSLCTIEGVVEEFCPDLNLFEIISTKLMERAKKNFDLKNELMSIGKDALEIGRKAAKIPAVASDVLKGLARGRTKINLELTGYEELVNKATSSVKSIMLALFACVLFFGSCLLCLADISPKAPGGIPFVAAAGFVFSIALAIYTVKNFGKK